MSSRRTWQSCSATLPPPWQHQRGQAMADLRGCYGGCGRGGRAGEGLYLCAALYVTTSLESTWHVLRRNERRIVWCPSRPADPTWRHTRLRTPVWEPTQRGTSRDQASNCPGRRRGRQGGRPALSGHPTGAPLSPSKTPRRERRTAVSRTTATSAAPTPVAAGRATPPRSCACPARRSFADTFRGVSPAAWRVTQRRCRRRSAMSRSRVRLAWPALSTSAPSYARGASPVIGTPPHNAYSTLSRLVVLLSPDSLDLFGGAGLPGASGRGA